MQTKKEKRIAEINNLRDILPVEKFEILISDNSTTVKVSSYELANSILKTLCPNDILDTENFNQVYLFAGLATDKAIAKKLKISIRLIVPIHQNFKSK